MRGRLYWLLVGLIGPPGFLAGIIWGVSPASADVTLIDQNGLEVSLSADAALGYFHTENANFGAGRFDFVIGDFTGRDAEWTEGYLRPSLDGGYELRRFGALYGGVSGVGAFTRGDGDAGGFTNGTEEALDLEELFIGWRSGQALQSLGENASDLSFGRQKFRVGDGFLIYDGNTDQFEKGTYWLAPRQAFERAALLRVNTVPVRGDAFYLRSDSDQDNTELTGLNVEYGQAGVGTFAAMYFHVLDSEPRFFGIRDGMDVISVRINEAVLPWLPGFEFWSQYVRETGSGDDGEIDAEAWYAEAKYTFANVVWTPSLSYRFATFSGDANPGDNKKKSFDPFFYGFGRGWGSWYQGEVTGGFLLFNSNQVNHMVHLNVAPNEALSVGAIYWNFSLDKKNYFGTPVASKSFTDELDIYADWVINDNLYLTGAYNVAFPGKAAKQVFGDDQPFHLFEVFFTLTF